MNEISPCKNCTDRHTACHGTCDKYKQWLDQYHAQQKYSKEHGYILYIPDSAARERTTRGYIKASGKVKERGGDR